MRKAFVFVLIILQVLTLNSIGQENQKQKQFFQFNQSREFYYKLEKYGFPHLHPMLISNDPYLNAISNTLDELEMADDKKKKAQSIIETNLPLIDNLDKNPSGSINVLSRDYPEIDWVSMSAAMVYSAKSGAIENITACLSLARCSIGNFRLAYDQSEALTNQRHVEMTPEERLNFWPAANAILSNQAKAVPLLITVLQNEKASEYQRIMAAMFLVSIDENLLTFDLLNDVKTKFAEKVFCIRKYKLGWKSYKENPCEQFETISPEDKERLLKRQQHLEEQQRKRKEAKNTK
ncbi:hypothetical protein K8I31_19780 [bacterium]|nr:hypothetical protein [bacterium]